MFFSTCLLWSRYLCQRRFPLLRLLDSPPKKDNVNRKLQFIRLVYLHSFIDKRFTFISIVNTKQTEITRNNAS